MQGTPGSNDSWLAPGRTPTMADVAAAAGVSIVTVSRALSTPASVLPETRERIVDAIKAVGYVPNEVAGSLRSKRTNLVATVIPSITHVFLSRMIQGISDALMPSGMHLVLSTSGETLRGEELAVLGFLAQRPRGLLLHNTAHTEECRRLLKHSAVPVIETGDLVPDPIGAAVSYSNYAASVALTRHLVDRGYRHIAFVSQTTENERSAERMRGFRDVLVSAGQATGFEAMIKAVPGPGSGAQALVELLASRPQTDAAIFAGDSMAEGALLECRRRGIPVPERIAIAAYEANDLADALQPSLTSIRIPRYEIGRKVAETLLSILAGATPNSNVVDLGFELVIREST